MASNIPLFPYLSEDLLTQIKIRTKSFCFFYKDQNNIHELKTEPLEALSTINGISDDEGIWDIERQNLGVNVNYSIENLKCLFGPQGIVCQSATLGIAVVWTSIESQQRGVFPIGTFSADQSTKDFRGEKIFEIAQLRGHVKFTTVIYIAAPGEAEDDELHLANITGYRLGEFDSYTVKLDGRGSVFPIFEVYAPDMPLWYVKCDWEDPTIDALTETVSINLNTAHKNYKYIDKKQEQSFNRALLIEIMSGAISVIIEKARTDPINWEKIINYEDIEEGSIGQAICYLKDTLEWELTTPESVSVSARKFFDKRM